MTPRSQDTIEVRPGEALDVESLAAYLDGRVEATGPLHVRQFGGGAANLTYELSFGEHSYVLRRPPHGPVAPHSHDMVREYRVLRAISDVYPYAPRPLLLCEDEKILGAPFFVMERRYGVVVYREMPPSLSDEPRSPRLMATAMVEALARLHDLDHEALGLGDFGRPHGFVERQVEGWWGRWERSKNASLATMDALHDWLRTNLPGEAKPSIIHNDFKLDNCMFAPDDPAELVAVFDWDMATIGDPLVDLGTLLAYWRQPDDDPAVQRFSPMPPSAGFPSRAELVAIYSQARAMDIPDLRFYQVLGLYRLAVILAQIHMRWRHGQTADERFERFWTLTELVAANAASIANDQALEYDDG